MIHLAKRNESKTYLGYREKITNPNTHCLLAFDFTGTMGNHNEGCSPEMVKSVKDLTKLGNTVLIVTADPKEVLDRYFIANFAKHGVEVPQKGLYAATSVGAIRWQFLNGEFQEIDREDNFSEDLKLKMLGALEDSVEQLVKSKGHSYTPPSDALKKRYLAGERLKLSELTTDPDLANTHFEGLDHKFGVFDVLSKKAPARYLELQSAFSKKVEQIVGDNNLILSCGYNFADICVTDKRVGVARSLPHIEKAQGSVQSIFTFGDSYNDKPLMTFQHKEGIAQAGFFVGHEPNIARKFNSEAGAMRVHRVSGHEDRTVKILQKMTFGIVTLNKETR